MLQWIFGAFKSEGYAIRFYHTSSSAHKPKLITETCLIARQHLQPPGSVPGLALITALV